jgi:hypothetical protein
MDATIDEALLRKAKARAEKKQYFARLATLNGKVRHFDQDLVKLEKEDRELTEHEKEVIEVLREIQKKYAARKELKGKKQKTLETKVLNWT